jgi:deazaflavin-dependent oxidoreductase (nitroreductase family)
MRRAVVIVGAVAAAILGGVEYWRRHPRVGTSFVNRVVDPWLVRQGIAEKTHGEIGLLEHVGRRSGTVRVSPVHPVPTPEGFRIIVPLGSESQWAQNVLAAGHCRLQVGDVVYQLDEPSLVSPAAVDGLPAFTGRLMDGLGFRYLLLRRFAEQQGELSVESPSAAPTSASEDLSEAATR